MSLLRAFIALDIPADIQQAVKKAVTDLRREIGSLVKWVPVENIHLTLKFLGDIPSSRLDELIAMLKLEAEACPSFEMRIGGLGSFPSPKRPRVLFIGIQSPAGPDPDQKSGLEALYDGIEFACSRLGFPSETRDFSPHLTLGRVRQNVKIADGQIIRRILESYTIDSPGMARVDSVQIYQSVLKPDGAVYTRLFSAPFKS